MAKIEENVFDPKAKDIAQRVYVYLPSLSPAIIEFWVATPFALAAMQFNSLQRESEFFKAMFPLGLFKSGIYDEVKASIMNDTYTEESLTVYFKGKGASDEFVYFFVNVLL